MDTGFLRMLDPTRDGLSIHLKTNKLSASFYSGCHCLLSKTTWENVQLAAEVIVVFTGVNWLEIPTRSLIRETLSVHQQLALSKFSVCQIIYKGYFIEVYTSFQLKAGNLTETLACCSRCSDLFLQIIIPLLLQMFCGPAGGKGSSNKMAKQASFAFMKRTLDRCRQFEKTGKSCFNEPSFRDIFHSGSARLSLARLTGKCVTIVGIMILFEWLAFNVALSN